MGLWISITAVGAILGFMVGIRPENSGSRIANTVGGTMLVAIIFCIISGIVIFLVSGFCTETVIEKTFLSSLPGTDNEFYIGPADRYMEGTRGQVYYVDGKFQKFCGQITELEEVRPVLVKRFEKNSGSFFLFAIKEMTVIYEIFVPPGTVLKE